jgi:serine/threonine protein kinase
MRNHSTPTAELAPEDQQVFADTVGSYVLLEPLGQGSMGRVFKARHTRMRHLAAVKFLHPGVLDRSGGSEHFLREVEAVARLDHPNVVQAYDAGFAGDTPYLAMEYVAGADLRRLVDRAGPLNGRVACECVRQAALGLQHAHARGVVHCDVKPSNLLLAGTTVKLVDFGLALLVDEMAGHRTSSGRFVGTPDYLAPEQARSPQSTDGRADLYSLGCTLYFLLTARVPFPSNSAEEKVRCQLSAEPEPVETLRPGLPPALSSLVRKLMAKHPEDRFQSAAEVASALGALVRDGCSSIPT